MTQRVTMTNLQFFRSCIGNEFQATKAILAAMPDDQLSYRPHPVNRSAGELAEHILAHVYDMEIILRESVCDERMTYPFNTASEAAEQLELCWERMKKAADACTEERWENSPVELKVNGKSFVTLTCSQMSWFFFFDLIHHRGQLSSYIRPMGGKNPAVYGYSADTMNT
jgi:uncharacterized damage-inducible protein DinB